MDVGSWLHGLGLGEYEEKFRDNKIDADVLAGRARAVFEGGAAYGGCSPSSC